MTFVLQKLTFSLHNAHDTINGHPFSRSFVDVCMEANLPGGMYTKAHLRAESLTYNKKGVPLIG